MRRVGKGRWLAEVALPVFPAVFLGVLAMAWADVSPLLWGQQAAAWALLSLLALPLRRAVGRIPALVSGALLLIILAASLFGQAVGGARRWVDLVVFHANAAQLIIPALLVLLGKMTCPYPALMGAAVVLGLQPDLSQLAAFCAAACVILWQRREDKCRTLGCAVILCACMLRCLTVPVVIEPVAYCEGILTMLAGRSIMLWAAGWIALALVPAWWMQRFIRQDEPRALILALYYAAGLLFVVSGKYPVAFMGFGLSPIAGYMLACAFCDADSKGAA